MEDVIGEAQWRRMATGSGRQCIATNRGGERCRKAPIVGGFVCAMHGGMSPIVQKSARERLLAMVDPALDALLGFLRQAPPCEHCGRTDADRDPVVLRAAQMVLDRTGFHPTMQLDVQPAPNPFADLNEDELIERLEHLLVNAVRDRDLRRAHILPAQPRALVEATPIPDGTVHIPVENSTTDEGRGADDQQP